jgi:hypothetical protein
VWSPRRVSEGVRQPAGAACVAWAPSREACVYSPPLCLPSPPLCTQCPSTTRGAAGWSASR